MTADSPIHGSAMLQMNTGRILSGSPCLGSWVNYGLGSVNENLPGFVVMLDPTGGPISGAKNWSSGYMPATYQGTILRAGGAPILDLDRPDGHDASRRSGELLDTLRENNDEHHAPRGRQHRPGRPHRQLRAGLQDAAVTPRRRSISARRPAETSELYGIDDQRTARLRPAVPAGPAAGRARRALRPALLRRRPQRRQLGRPRRPGRATTPTTPAETDKPIAGLLKDLKRRGLLDETLVVWGGEFGRQPTAEYAKGTGRDHNAYGFTMWMAGGGIKGGVSVGETDELGTRRRRATASTSRTCTPPILHQLGLDPNRLTYFYGGLDQKLVGVEGAEPIRQII